MTTLAILAFLVTLTNGYVIQRPQTSYGVPLNSGQSVSSNDRPSQFLESSQFGSSSSSFSSSNSNSLQSSGASFQNSGSSQNSFQQKPEIFKHIYVHVAPEDKEEQVFRQQLPFAPPKKHYKIIFIKTPEPPAPIVQQIPLQALNEEKTLVYVLLKQREEAPELVIPSAVATEPSKPEVYFIKYKAKKENTGSSSSSSSSSDAFYNESSSSSALSNSSANQNTNESSSGSFSENSGGYLSGIGSSSSSSSSSLGTVNSSSAHKPAQAYGPPGYY